jgi:hypothetical protein
MIEVVKHLRNSNPDSPVARLIEKESCVQMLLLLPFKAGTSDDALFPGVSKDVARAVIVGILKNRPCDSGNAIIAKPSASPFWRSWERQAG